MKILITTSVDPRNSAYSRLHAIMKHLNRRNDITVVSVRDFWKEKQKSSKIHKMEFDRHLGDTKLRYLASRERTIWLQEIFSGRIIKGLLKSGSLEMPDVILDYNTILIGRQVAELMPMIPRIYDIADDIPDMIRNSPQVPLRQGYIASRIGAMMIIRGMRSASIVTTTTPNLARRFDAPPNRTVVIPNGVDYVQLQESAKDAYEGCMRKPGEFVVIYVGVLREWVDMEPILRAIHRLRPVINMKLIVIGDEGDASSVRGLATRYGVEDSVTMMGTIPHDRIGCYISSCDCGIIPFRQGRTADMALPLKLFEYLALGVPVVSTRIPAVVERFKDEVSFYDTEEEFMDCIKDIVGNPERAQGRAAEGKRRVREQYSWNSVLVSLDQSIHRAVEHSSASECDDGTS